MATSLRHIALFVRDLRAAEAYYRDLFDMTLVGREALLPDGLYYTLPYDKDWEDAETAGVELSMLALRKGEAVLALFKGDAPHGQVFAIGMRMSKEEIAAVRGRLPAEAAVLDDRPESLVFMDPYRITWQLSLVGNEFRTAGEWAGRWLEL